MPILYIMAAEQEYGPHLKARIAPVITGVGPVGAAIGTTAALIGAVQEGNRPDLVVSLGSAGSRTLQQAGIYQATSVLWRDMDATALGFPRGVTPFLDLPAEHVLPVQVAGIPGARLSTGANIVSGAAYDGIDADMVDMETYAVLRACQRFGVPLLAIRGISDGPAELRQLSDWTQYLHVIDEKLAVAVDLIEQAHVRGELRTFMPQSAAITHP